MKNISLTISVLVIGSIIGWSTCYYFNRAKLFNVYTPEYIEWSNELAENPELRNLTEEDWKEVLSNIVTIAEAHSDPNDEMILGMAYMAQQHFKKEMNEGIDAANKNRIAIINSYLKNFSQTNWGTLQDIADKISSTANEYPDIFIKQTSNQRVEPTVKTSVDLGNVQGTDTAHP